jgi:hypothetical protein
MAAKFSLLILVVTASLGVSKGYREHIMAPDLKFIASDTSFDPETINLLSDAFEHAWQKVQNGTSGLRRSRHL